MKKAVFFLALLLSVAQAAMAQGYRNPILNADVPDICVCHHNGKYYMISTTMHLMPGGPVMESADGMRTWKTVSYVFDRIDDGPRYDLEDGQTVYGQGQWASSIRYHKGKFWVWFTVNGAPGRGFVFCADKAEGPWQLVGRPPHHHDASLLFDDDGRNYLFYGTGEVEELNADLTDVKPGGFKKKIFERDAEEKQALLEGSSIVKRNGKYYLLMISMQWGVKGRVRREVCYRADRIDGPWEKKVILETPFESYGGVGQGCIVSDGQDNWLALIFQDRGGVGRVPCLMPCTWVDGWPMLGDLSRKVEQDGYTYNMAIPCDYNVPFASMEGICGSDDFAGNKLGLQWQWNHNPITSGWGLTGHSLRLITARTALNLFLAPNTLTQRMTGPTCTGTVELTISGMKDGDRAGLAAFQGQSGVLVVKREGGKNTLCCERQNSIFGERRTVKGVEVEGLDSVALTDTNTKVWLRTHGDFRPGQDVATFEYSLDGKKFTPIGRAVKVPFDYTRMFMGTKFGIFYYATREVGGVVDVEQFDYQQEQ